MFFKSHGNFQLDDFRMISPLKNIVHQIIDELLFDLQKIKVVIIATRAVFSGEEYTGRIVYMPVVPFDLFMLDQF